MSELSNSMDALQAVSRKVGLSHAPSGEDHTVLLTRTYQAEIEELWDACTSAERIGRWLTPISGELKLGGRYQLEGNAGGTIERCEPPRSLRVSWEFGADVSWVELRLTAAGDGASTLELEHIAPGDPDKWREFGPGAVGVGWDLALLGLGRVAVERAERDEAAVAAWLASPAGREFLSASVEGWREADVLCGADPHGAATAARNTEEFYAPMFAGRPGAP
jgi:uncharacterized protein YndB with AHSA1/START domain